MANVLSGLHWRPQQVQHLAFPVTAVLVVAVAHQAAHLTWRLVPEPAPGALPPVDVVSLPVGDNAPSRSPEVVARWHLFGRAEPSGSGESQRIEAPETQLNLELKGVFYSPDPARAQVIINGSSRDRAHYRVGDAIGAGGRIEAIYEDRVILRRQGAYETLSLPGERVALDRRLAQLRPADAAGARSGASAPGQSVATSTEGDSGTAVRRRLAENPAQLAQMLNLQPVMEEGRMVGVEVSPGPESGVMETLGLEPGDVVTSIGGRELSSPSEALQALRDAGDGPVTVRVRRGDSRQTVEVDLDRGGEAHVGR